MSDASSASQPLIRPAGIEDFDALKAVLDKANRYSFEKNGETQWTTMDHVYNQLRTDIERGGCFVLKDKSGNITAAVTLSEDDTYMWGDEGDDGQALYFHKLMKDPENSPDNTGLIFISFAAQEALRRDKTFLRCDTKPTMTGLVAYYEKLGFAQKHQAEYASTGKAAILFEADPQQIIKRLASLAKA